MSDSVWSHRRQPTRLPRPQDSPGKNTGVGCHFPLQCVKVKSEGEAAQSCPTLSDPMGRSLPGSFIHGIFQERVLEWGAIAFSGKLKLHWDSTGQLGSWAFHPRTMTQFVHNLTEKVPALLWLTQSLDWPHFGTMPRLIWFLQLCWDPYSYSELGKKYQ